MKFSLVFKELVFQIILKLKITFDVMVIDINRVDH